MYLKNLESLQNLAFFLEYIQYNTSMLFHEIKNTNSQHQHNDTNILHKILHRRDKIILDDVKNEKKSKKVKTKTRMKFSLRINQVEQFKWIQITCKYKRVCVYLDTGIVSFSRAIYKTT